MARTGRRPDRAKARAERQQLAAGRAARRAQSRRRDTAQELWRRQRWHLFGCLVFTGLFLAFLAGMMSELAGGYVWPVGELVADSVTLVVSPVLAWVTGRRARALECRAVANVVVEDWLPPAPEGTEPGIDLGEQTARLRGLVSRAVFAGLLSTVVAGLGGFGSTIGEDAAQRLFDTGTKVVGAVVDTDSVDSTFRVRFPVPGGDQVAVIRWDTDIRYVPGMPVAVVYDPADPGRARTIEEANDVLVFSVVGTSLVVVGGIGILMCLPAALAWQRRYRSVRETGWRSAEATVSSSLDGGMPAIVVRYADGSRILLKSALSLHDAWRVAGPSRRVWVGGTDERMVVLFPRGRWRQKPYAVPACGRTARDPGLDR